jgi:hypothetical protein
LKGNKRYGNTEKLRRIIMSGNVNSYESPFCTRYASEEMQYIFSADKKFTTWRKLWVALARAEMKLGLPVTEAQVKQLEEHINDVDYADQIDWNNSDANGTTSSEGNSTSKTEHSGSGNVKADQERSESENSLEEVKGNYGQMSYQYLVKKYRELILNIDQMIINDPRIQELFMLVY